MADSVRRRSSGGVLPLGRHTSISGSSLVQCASVSMAPPPLSRGAKRPQPHPVQARTGPSLYQLGSELWQALRSAISRTIRQRNVLSLVVAQLVQSLKKWLRQGRILVGKQSEVGDPVGPSWLLRPS